MTRLSVNINKLATIRNARGGNNPDILSWATLIQSCGAQGITVHPRPDERHIRRSDVNPLRDVVHTEFNIEGYPSEDFIAMVIDANPEQVTLVPDPPEVLTSNAGWDVISHKAILSGVIGRFKAAGIRTSLFMETDPAQISAAAAVGADRIELYTEDYARSFGTKDAESVLNLYRVAARHAIEIGLGINAGHDLDLDNLAYFVTEVPGIEEVSIGHALICDALRFGMDNTVRMYLKQLA
jgi:pyridoxine 5-phosphate synthase